MTCPILRSIDAAELSQDAAIVAHRLKASHWASYMAARYNGAVFLIGSLLTTKDPRDIDIVVVVSDKEFCGRYELEEYYGFPCQKWIDDLAKRSGELARDFGFNPDFKVYPASYCIQDADKPRYLLAAPSRLEHIVESVAWWFHPPEQAPTPAEVTVETGFEGEELG